MSLSSQYPDFQPVQVIDDVGDAIAAAQAHAAAYYAKNPGKTLIDGFTAEEIANWDGSDEKALVSDPDGLDDFDGADEDL